MLHTDIMTTYEGKQINVSFDNHKDMYNYMLENGITSCRAYTTIASVKVTEEITITLNDLEKVLP